MKCSHGLPYEVRCHSCMHDALARIGLGLPQAPAAMPMKVDNPGVTVVYSETGKVEYVLRKR